MKLEKGAGIEPFYS